jgi:hypothetical protein
MREIKFRQFIVESGFHYWGNGPHEDGAKWKGPCSNGGGGEQYQSEQYTGLKDKNGKEIYEGDIIHRINKSSCCGKIKYEETQLVKWEGTGFYGFPVPDSPLGSCGFAGINSEEVFVIGNIHENNELLE